MATKAIIYTRVSTKEQSSDRQIGDMRDTKYEVVKVFSENVSGFTKPMAERKELQKAMGYMEQHKIKVLCIHEISRLGRNTVECLNLLKALEKKGISIYIHTLGIELSSDKNDTNKIFMQLITVLMTQLAEMESQQLSLRIKSGIRERKRKGLHTGRKVDSKETREKFLAKHKQVIKYLQLGRSYSEITKLTGTAPATISKVKKVLAET
jgi:DNA invertase Pin-like site-specific DNA recombinase